MSLSSPVGTVTTYTFNPSGAIEDWVVPFHDARICIKGQLGSIGDVAVAEVAGLFPDWEPGVAVAAGDVLAWDGTLVEVIQAHTTQADWTPDKVPALWTPVRKVAGAAPDEWVQPVGASDAYRKGDRVLFQGAVWESVIDANVWSPTAYPAGWKKVT